MSGGGSVRDQGKILVIVAGSDYEEGGVDTGGVQRIEDGLRCFAWAVVKGQADPFLWF